MHELVYIKLILILVSSKQATAIRKFTLYRVCERWSVRAEKHVNYAIWGSHSMTARRGWTGFGGGEGLVSAGFKGEGLVSAGFKGEGLVSAGFKGGMTGFGWFRVVSCGKDWFRVVSARSAF